MKELNLKKYKDKYVQLKDIYQSIRKKLRYKDKRITYSTYYKIMTAYLEEYINEIAVNKQEVELPSSLGKTYIKKEQHKRPFHVMIDTTESFKKGKVIKYKIPILSDYYNKLVWERTSKYKRYKILPLRKFKRLINQVNEY